MSQLSKAQFLVFDFDGVFTDNKVYINERGEEMVRCDRSDTVGLDELILHRVSVMILSREKNKVVRMRANKLKIPCVHGIKDKRLALIRECKRRNIDPSKTIYVGNDANDIPCFEIAGTSIAVADAHQDAKEKAQYVTRAKGGDGAVREVIAMLIKAKTEG